jgi:DNA-binding NarL/FixJ family response regulator
MDMLRILIADDHPAVRRSLRSLVQTHADWDVCGEAFDGLDAVEKAKVLRPDIVLLDISMPNMSGIEATPLIHQAVPQSEILIVSQHDSPEITRLVAEAGAQGYVSKSEVWSQLLPAIESARHKDAGTDSPAKK